MLRLRFPAKSLQALRETILRDMEDHLGVEVVGTIASSEIGKGASVMIKAMSEVRPAGGGGRRRRGLAVASG